MKLTKYLLLGFLFSLLFSQLQEVEAQEVKTIINSTVANDQVVTGYAYLPQKMGYVIDSASFQITAKGEIDIDAISIRFGWVTNDIRTLNATAVDSTALTIDNAAGVTTTVFAVGSTVTGAPLNHVNVLDVRLYGASSGNDATDPNLLIVDVIIYYRQVTGMGIVAPGG